jgi:hypothetical protein
LPVAVGQNRASHAAAKIPDIRIELRSKRIPGTREDRAWLSVSISDGWYKIEPFRRLFDKLRALKTFPPSLPLRQGHHI